MRATAVVAVALASAAGVAAAPLGPPRTVLEPAPASGDFFAAALAADAARVVVGARFADAVAVDAGAAYVVDVASGTVVVTLGAATPAAGDQFGAAVALVGDAVAVGAPHARVGDAIGAVFLFDATSFAPRATIANPSGASDDLFGSALAPVGGDLAVGAPFATAGAPGAGAVHVFDPGTGTLVRTIPNPTPGDYDLFGQAIAAVGDALLVGAPLADGGAPNGGAAYLFAADGTPAATLTGSLAGALFGSAVAALGADPVVGAPLASDASAIGGAVYRFDGATGSLRLVFTDPDASEDERFGAAIAAVGGGLLVGAPLADDGVALDVGVALLLDPDDGSVIQTLANPTPDAGDEFGATLVAVGAGAAVGAWLDDAAAPNAGALHLFAATGAATTTTTVTTPTTATSSTTTTVTSTTETTADPGETTTTVDGATTTTDTTDATTTTTDAATSTTAADTTTTTLPGGDPSACDDHDPCTDDLVLAQGGCVHVAREGVDGASCRLATLAAMLAAAPPGAVGGTRVARTLARRVHAATTILSHADPAHPKPRPMRHAAALLDGFAATERRASHRGRALPALADALVTRATALATTLATLAHR